MKLSESNMRKKTYKNGNSHEQKNWDCWMEKFGWHMQRVVWDKIFTLYASTMFLFLSIAYWHIGTRFWACVLFIPVLYILYNFKIFFRESYIDKKENWTPDLSNISKKDIKQARLLLLVFMFFFLLVAGLIGTTIFSELIQTHGLLFHILLSIVILMIAAVFIYIAITLFVYILWCNFLIKNDHKTEHNNY